MHMVNRRGFTIVELLIVIVVIAVLATFSIVAYNGVTARAYENRAQSEMSGIARAVASFNVLNERYPADVDRGIPPEVTELMNGSSDNWPKAPWPGSVYDYDYWPASGSNEETVQLSIRFCPIGISNLSECSFPSQSWANGFRRDSSYYWCIKGTCRAHNSQPVDYPGKCANCKE